MSIEVWKMIYQIISIACTAMHLKFSTTNPIAAVFKGTGKGN